MATPQTSAPYHVLPGRASPLGATPDENGINFAIVCPRADRATLGIFEGPESVVPMVEFPLSRDTSFTGSVWSVYIEGLQPGTIYAWRFEGHKRGKSSALFDPERYVLDPYARVLVDNRQGGQPKGMAIACDSVRLNHLPNHAWRDALIYEVHVKGFTAHESSGVSHPGTYGAFIEKIPHLQELGVTAVEFLPLQACGEHDLGRTDPDTKEPLHNYWGYSTLGFFAVDRRYAASGDPGKEIDEFKALVTALHDANIEVIVDVVYNHTSEGGDGGRVQSFSGIDPSYYHRDSKSRIIDYTGCGNSLSCNWPAAAELISESLRYWTETLGVDGFRFDLAPVLNRDEKGALHQCAPLITRLSEDSHLGHSKLIAEAWDVGGAYQVGSFGTSRWRDWNDRFRDDVRRYWRGDEGVKNAFALRLQGSPDLYAPNDRGPLNSINFITCHDGFTLRDWSAYNHKHNEANGEENRDGTDNNLSWNCGVEGPTDDPEINELRDRMRKSMMATLFLSLGVPMLTAGDEFGRTQLGNNNAYCQDNAVSWVDWGLKGRDSGFFEFCKALIAFRRANPVFRRGDYFTGKAVAEAGLPDISWHGFRVDDVPWDTADAVLGWRIDGSQNKGKSLYLMFNPTLLAREFFLPDGEWRIRVNTARGSGEDIVPAERASVLPAEKSFVLGRKALAVAEAAG